MFIVFKMGIYRHEIVGLTVRLDKAKEIADREIRKEEDDHHYFAIVWMEVDDDNVGELTIFELSRVGTSRSGISPYHFTRHEYTWESLITEEAMKCIEASPVDSIKAFAYDLLKKDPIAIDILNDVVASGGVKS